MITVWCMTNDGTGQMTAALKDLRQILVHKNSEVKDGSVWCALERSPQRRPMEKAQAMLLMGTEEAKWTYSGHNVR